MWTSGCECCHAGVWKRGEYLSTLRGQALQNRAHARLRPASADAWAPLYSGTPGFPHRAWKVVGVWCGQVSARLAAQAFQSMVIFSPATGGGARNANAPHKAGRPGSIRCRWIRRCSITHDLAPMDIGLCAFNLGDKFLPIDVHGSPKKSCPNDLHVHTGVP